MASLPLWAEAAPPSARTTPHTSPIRSRRLTGWIPSPSPDEIPPHEMLTAIRQESSFRWPGDSAGRIGRMEAGQRTATRTRVTPLGAGAVLMAVAGFSVTNIILKITRATALSFAFYRLWAGALVMWAVLGLTGRRLSMDVIRRSVWGGVVFGFNVSLFFLALKATNVADVLVIQSLQPALILMVAGPLFGEHITRWDVWWTVVSVGGVVLVTVGSSGTPVWSLRGDVFAVGSLLCWTAYFLVSKHARKRVPATEYMAVVTTTAAVVVT